MRSSKVQSDTMRAMAIDTFGGPDVLTLHEMAVPEFGPEDVLIKVAFAGVGVWDGAIRQGLMEGQAPAGSSLPRILGADCSGTITDVGDQVSGFAEGDAVYAYTFLNPNGGSYAEYVAVPVDQVARIPTGLPMDQAGALAVTGLTALRGLGDTLGVKEGDKVLIFGASGGVGHPAVQLAKSMGALVLATVASADGADAADEAGADVVVNTRTGDLAVCIERFAPTGLAGVLALTAGEGLDIAIAAVRDGGVVAFPFGIQPEPAARAGIDVKGYMGAPGREAFDRLNSIISGRNFFVHIAGRFPLDEAADAHRALKEHHVGRLLLAVE